MTLPILLMFLAIGVAAALADGWHDGRYLHGGTAK